MPTTDLTHGAITTLGQLRPGDDQTIEQTIRRVLDAAVADGVATCTRNPFALTTGELVGPANVLNDAMGELLRRIAELEEQVRTLREALEETLRWAMLDDDRSNPQPISDDDLGDHFRPVVERARAALAATAPKEKP